MRLRVKIVPDAEPSAPGEWIEREVDAEVLPPAWSEVARLLCDRLPANHHFVAYERIAA